MSADFGVGLYDENGESILISPEVGSMSHIGRYVIPDTRNTSYELAIPDELHNMTFHVFPEGNVTVAYRSYFTLLPAYTLRPDKIIFSGGLSVAVRIFVS